ncbi:hypothetical protein CYMTET_13398 [Cymbomonas tetramitiformis]|uniref:Caffeoyl-CoA O-methyltransferase n=1 Tax=Cymbomonas tetramitiformis TaxID=36881 RepID=A0AAE0GIG9_9CHLO|nr:hypothetical protein CYMTET_13398 [Cymbomonas tetramitiformis]
MMRQECRRCMLSQYQPPRIDSPRNTKTLSAKTITTPGLRSFSFVSCPRVQQRLAVQKKNYLSRRQTSRKVFQVHADVGPVTSVPTSVPSEADKDLGPINKPSIVLDDKLYSYLLRHTREPKILRKLREETATMRGAVMQTPPEQAAFLALLVELMGVTKGIEIGVFTGYSCLALALALPEDGQLVACERDHVVLQVAKRYLQQAGVAHKVDCREGAASATLEALLEEGGNAQYDFAYVDADKRGYAAYYEQLLQLVRPGGLIAFDNMLWKGRVADDEVNDKQTVAIRALNADLLEDDRITVSTVPIGDGLVLCRVR